jgi:hypothetical protein
MQNGKGPASNRSLDSRGIQQPTDSQQPNSAYQLNGNAAGNRNQEIPVAGGISLNEINWFAPLQATALPRPIMVYWK